MTQASKPKANTHHIQFTLVDDNLDVIKQPRAYQLSWTPAGEKQATTIKGMTDAAGQTQRVQTAGPVVVTLEIAPPDGGPCEMVGSTTTRPLAKQASVRVQLQFSGQATSQLKQNQACAQLTVREGKQRIQYVINNLPKYKTYKTYLQNLPYFIVNADTLEVLSDSAQAPKEAPRMQGTQTQVSTAVVHVDGIKEVGLVLGSATDDRSRWKAKNLVFYKVTPKESGLTQIIINEFGEVGIPAVDAVKVNDFKTTLNGNVWAQMCRSFTVADVQAMLPGGLNISAAQPTDMQIDYARARGVITDAQAQAYKAQRLARHDAATQTRPAGKAEFPQAKPLPPLQYWCNWAELLEPIYAGHIVDSEPPNPQIPDIDPKTKKQKLDPKTKKPLTAQKYTGKVYQKLVLQGEGKIIIRPLGLTLALAGPISTGGEPFAENAQEITGLSKAAVMAKTHPFTYLAVLEACHDCAVHYLRIGCTWRPMIGSVFHKLGDAIDIGKIDSEADAAPAFTFLNATVDTLADKFTRALDGHRYAKANGTIYNRDHLPTNAPRHDDHLHFTADRLKQVCQQDITIPKIAKSDAH